MGFKNNIVCLFPEEMAQSLLDVTGGHPVTSSTSNVNTTIHACRGNTELFEKMYMSTS